MAQTETNDDPSIENDQLKNLKNKFFANSSLSQSSFNEKKFFLK